MGGSFVDLSLRIITSAAPGSIQAFKSECMHGTTVWEASYNSGFTYAMTKRVYEAMQNFIDKNEPIIYEFEATCLRESEEDEKANADKLI